MSPSRSTRAALCRDARTPRRLMILAALFTAATAGAQTLPQRAGSSCDGTAAQVLNVGPGQTYRVPSAAADVARAGDVVRIAAGDYRGDVAVWRADHLTLCGVGGRVRLFAQGNSAQDKAIWVITGTGVVVDNIEFRDAKVADQNGAGIRFEGGDLTVRNSAFFDNESGILSGNRGGDIVIERCEFGRNGYGDDQSHNIYVGRSNRLTVTNSFFHGAKSGHNLKSRARESRIEYSYFMDGLAGNSSYLADFSNGGVVYLRGNLFQKGPNAENWTAIAFGPEGLKWDVNTLEMVHNTIVMTRPGGFFLSSPAGARSIKLTANLLAGTGNVGLITGGKRAVDVDQYNNFITTAIHFKRADSLSSPNFWPSAELLPQIGLSRPSEPGDSTDAPRPLEQRRIPAGARRYIGALQASP